MKRNITFSENALSKIDAFFTMFKKDPSQSVAELCREIKASKSTVYEYCRHNKIVLSDVRNGNMRVDYILDNLRQQIGGDKTEPNIKINKGKEPTTREAMEYVVNKVDDFRRQGFSVEEAAAKAKISVHFATYYAYKRSLNKMNEKLKKQENKSEKVSNVTDIIPVSLVPMPIKTRKKRAYNKKPDHDVPTAPYTIEYVHEKKPPKNKQEIIMMIGNAESLLDFLKMRGDKYE